MKMIYLIFQKKMKNGKNKKKNYFRAIPKNEKLVIETFEKLIDANGTGQALLYTSFNTNLTFRNIC